MAKTISKIAILTLCFAVTLGLTIASLSVFGGAERAESQVSQIQQRTVFSASSTVPGVSQVETKYQGTATTLEEAEANGETRLAITTATTSTKCNTLVCPSLIGTQDKKLSALSSGGTFVEASATTSLLLLDTSNTEKIRFSLQRMSSSTPATQRNYVGLEVSNDGFDWYPYNGKANVSANTSNTENANVPLGYSYITQLTGNATSSAFLIWNYPTVNTQGRVDSQRVSFVVDNVVSKWMRLDFTSAGTSSVRVEATELTPL